MIKKFGILLILLLFINCSKNKSIEGFWYSQKHKTLLKFENDSTYTNYFYSINSGHYVLTGNKLFWSNAYEKPNTLKVKITISELFLHHYKSDSLLTKYNRSKSNNFFYDYLNDKTLKIELPTGNGKLQKLGSNNYSFNFPLYLTYRNDTLISNFNGFTKPVNDNYHRFLRKNTAISFDEIYKVPISLIADKNIKIKDIISLERQLRLSGFENIHYLNKTDSYDGVNYLGIRMFPLPKKKLEKYDLDFKEEGNIPLSNTILVDDDALVITSNHDKSVKVEVLPMPKIEFTDLELKFKLLEIDKSKIIFDNKKVSLVGLKNTIRKSLVNNFAIFYYITDNSSYQDFISVLDIIYNTIEELRSEYLLEKYNLIYPTVNIQPNDIERDIIREVEKKHPFMLFRMNYEDYQEVKESL